jgi:hypothetical protein
VQDRGDAANKAIALTVSRVTACIFVQARVDLYQTSSARLGREPGADALSPPLRHCQADVGIALALGIANVHQRQRLGPWPL